MKKTTSLLLVSLVASASVVGLGSSATALEPVPDLYTVNVANQSGSSYARDFVTLNGLTYFTASSVSDGRAIWSLAATEGAVPQLVLDPVDGVVHGEIEKMTAVGDYLLLWLNSAFDGQGDYSAVAYNLTTEMMTPLVVGGTTVTASYSVFSNFAVITGDLGSVAYVVGGQDGEGNQTLYAFDLDTGVASIADEMVDVRVTNDNRDGLVASGQRWHPTLVALGSQLYVADFESAAPPAGSYCVNWGYSDWSSLRAFDTVTEAWGSPVQVSGEDFALAGVRVHGTFELAGEQVAITAAASVKGCYFNHTFQYYATKADGTTTRLGTWSTAGTSSFVNLNGGLYFMEGGLWLIDPTTGERSNAAATMFPTAAAVTLWNAVQVDSHLVFAAQARPTVNEYNQPIYLYQWDGTSAATVLSSAPLGQAVGVAPNAPSIYDWKTNADSDGQARSAIGVVGTRAITSLYESESTAGEPHLISIDDSATLVANINKASDGSDPDTDCFATFDNVDVIAGNLPTQTSGWGKDVFVELKGEDGYLKYSVLDPGAIQNMCGFVLINDDLYFTASDTETYNSGLYRMGTDRVITKVVDVPEESDEGFTNGTDYVFRGDSDYDTDWWMWNATTNEVIQLTGTGSDLIRDDSIEEAVQIGSIVYFPAELEENGDDHLFSIDLANPTATPVQITPDHVGSGYLSPEYLAVLDGTLVFGGEGLDDNGELIGGDSVYIYDPATQSLEVLFDPAADGTDGYIERIFTVGNQVVVLYHDDADPSEINDLYRATAAGVVTPSTFVDGFAPQCAAPAGNDIAVSNSEGQAYFYRDGGDTMQPIDYSFAGDTYALCESVSSVNGTYLSIPEYPFDRGPFANEAGYLGFLTPIAVERLGETVNEPPSTPYSPTPPPADAPGTVGAPTATVGDGSITLTWAAPSTGGAPGGYRITSSPAGAVCVIVDTSASCTGLTVGETYTFVVEAYNFNGYGPTSTASNAVVAPVGSDSGFGGGGVGDGGDSGGGGDGTGDGDGAGDGDNAGDGDSAGEGADNGGLASTGFSSPGLIPFALVLLALGVLFVVIAARRRTAD